MAGTIEGGKAAAKANKASDPDFFRKIGAKGGKAPHKIRGFQNMTHEQVSYYGSIGGKISRRPSKKRAYNSKHEPQPSMERPSTSVVSQYDSGNSSHVRLDKA